MNLTCPKCWNDEQSSFIGHEVRGVYDGVLVWQCGACSHVQPRDFGPGYERRHAAAREYADRLNAAAQGLTDRLHAERGDA